MSRIVLENAIALWLLPVALLALALLCRRSTLTLRGRVCVAVLRFVAIFMVVLALAHPVLVRSEKHPAPFSITILRDVSDSMAADAPRRDVIVDELVAGITNVPVTVIDFAADIAQRGAMLDSSQTNLQDALENVFAMTARQPSSHVIVVSDGRENVGSAAGIARWFAARGGAVHAIGVGEEVPLAPAIVRIEPSVQNEVGVPIRFTAIIDAPGTQTFDAVLLADDGKELDRKRLAISGQRAIVLSATAQEPGASEYRLELRKPNGDVLQSAQAIAHVKGPPAVLIVDPFTDETDHLVKAFSPLGLKVEICSPDELPEQLGRYSAIVLSDLSGSEFTREQRERIRQQVESGTGLLFIGGSNAVPQRWRNNQLAELLPFTFDQPKPEPKPKRELTVCYVLDRSGSMDSPLDGNVSKMELVKSAVIASLRDLPAEARVAVIVFDGAANMVVAPTPVSERDKIIPIVERIVTGGGTNMSSGIDMALQTLAQEKGERYMVVLTDGVTVQAPAGWEQYSRDAIRLQINWTSIAVGADADRALMQWLANAAGGQYFFCGTATRIPKVFISQAQNIRRQKKEQREPFTPSPGPDFSRLHNIADVPELADAVDTQPRQGADVMLLGRDSMPLLAGWRFGLGQVIAFSSSAKPDWAGKWHSWRHNSLLWMQLLQQCLKPPSDLFARTRVYEERNQLVVEISVTAEDGTPVTDLKHANVDEHTLEMAHSPRPGQYLFRVSPGESRQVTHIVLSNEMSQLDYSLTHQRKPVDEARIRGVDEAALRSLCELGNGVYSRSPTAVLNACKPPPDELREIRKSLLPLVAGIAIMLWLADLTVRKFSST